MIHARISGARAPASRNHRAIVWTSHPLKSAGPGVPAITLLLLSLWYQVRKIPMARRIPPTIAMISDRDRPASSFIERTLPGTRRPGLRARDGHRHGRAGVARGGSLGGARGARALAGRPAEAPPPALRGGHQRGEDAAGLIGRDRIADVLEVAAAL